MTHTPVTHRERALVELDIATTYADLINTLHEERHDNPARSSAIGQRIGEANGLLGLALKKADVHATLAIADAINETRPAPERAAGGVVHRVNVFPSCQHGDHDRCAAHTMPQQRLTVVDQ